MVPKKQLIYADDLIKIMRAEDIRYQDVPWSTTAVAKLCEPMTVDAVEVVRCKDCKYAMDMMPIENSGGCLMGECTLRKEDDIVFTAWGDEFCSYGERKDNG